MYDVLASNEAKELDRAASAERQRAGAGAPPQTPGPTPVVFDSGLSGVPGRAWVYAGAAFINFIYVSLCALQSSVWCVRKGNI